MVPESRKRSVIVERGAGMKDIRGDMAIERDDILRFLQLVAAGNGFLDVTLRECVSAE